jgi:hypothetical protein
MAIAKWGGAVDTPRMHRILDGHEAGLAPQSV